MTAFLFLSILFTALTLFPCIRCVHDDNSIACYRRSYYIENLNLVCDVRDVYEKPESEESKTIALQKKKEAKNLPRIDPIKVGFSRQIEFDGKNYTRKTLSLKPPIFETVWSHLNLLLAKTCEKASCYEIQDFLSSDECDLLIKMAKATGLATSQTVWQEYVDVLEEGNLYPVFKKLDINDDDALDYFELAQGVQGIKDVHIEVDDIEEMFKHFELNFFDDGNMSFSEFEILTSPDVFEQIKSYLDNLENQKSQVKSRQSFSAFLDPFINTDHIEFFDQLYDRISKVTELPIEMIRSSEAVQVIKYEVNGHYHAHFDSENSEYAPCCHLIRDNTELCRPCRYATMFYYLNEPIEGGGTAFPFADNETYDDVKTNREDKYRLNLSRHCDEANLVYKPKKGTALFWYNHVIDDATGWVGKLDEMSSHGGCDVIEGVKWAANNWLNANSDREKDWELWRSFADNL